MSGVLLASGLCEQLTVTAGQTSATWDLLSPDADNVEAIQFPLLILNADDWVLAVFRKRSSLSVWPVWGWQHHPRRRREMIFPVSLNSRIIGNLPCPITRRRSPFAFGVATMRNATPCLRFARVVIAANAIVGLLADSALVAHKWPPPGGVIKRQTQEGELTVSDNLGTGTVPPSRA